MIRLLFIFFLPLVLDASKILSYNIYDRTDRADVMITFDTPYSGVIKQSSSKSKIIIKLMDAKIESAKIKQLASKFLYSLSITPMAGYTQIVASVPSSVKIKASKTSDAYGLRFRFTNKSTTKSKNTTQSKNDNPLSNFPTKKDGDITQSYYIVIAILIIGIAILFFIRKKALPKKEMTKQNSWLFKEDVHNKHEQQIGAQTSLDNSVSIRFQKNIDSTNSVIMLDFDEQSYLILMGKNNILLDKFSENRPATQEDFEKILQNRHQELDEFLRVESTSYADEPIDALQAYKDKAASISYET